MSAFSLFPFAANNSVSSSTHVLPPKASATRALCVGGGRTYSWCGNTSINDDQWALIVIEIEKVVSICDHLSTKTLSFWHKTRANWLLCYKNSPPPWPLCSSLLLSLFQLPKPTLNPNCQVVMQYFWLLCYHPPPPPPPRLLSLRGSETNPNFLLCLSIHMTSSEG